MSRTESQAEKGMLMIGTAFIIIAIVMLMCSQAHAQQSIRWFKDNNGVYYANTYSTNAPVGWSDTNVYAVLYKSWNTNASGFIDESANANVAGVTGAGVARYNDGAGHYWITNSGAASSYLNIPAVTGFVMSNDFTLTFWAKFNVYGTRVDLYGFGASAGNGSMNWRMLEPSGAKLRFYTAASSENNYDLYDTATTIANNNWHHFAMTWTKASRTIKFFIDAVENAQATTTGGSAPLGVLTGPMIIAGNAGGVATLNGAMDYFGVMQYALSPSGVTNLYQNTNPTGVP